MSLASCGSPAAVPFYSAPLVRLPMPTGPHASPPKWIEVISISDCLPSQAAGGAGGPMAELRSFASPPSLRNRNTLAPLLVRRGVIPGCECL